MWGIEELRLVSRVGQAYEIEKKKTTMFQRRNTKSESFGGVIAIWIQGQEFIYQWISYLWTLLLNGQRLK